MKVVHIITDLKQGGAQKILLKIISDKSKYYERVIISLIGNDHYKEILKNLKIRSYSLNMSRNSLNITKIFSLYKILKIEKPQVVQTWMYHCDLIGGLISKFLGIKNVYWGVVSFNLDADVMKLSSRIIVKINAVLSYFIPKKIIYCAKSSELIHIKKGFCKKKSIHIPVGFDKVENSIFEGQKIKNNIFTLGCIARWDPQKDHENLFKALKILDQKKIEYKCILASIGMDEDNSELQSMINQIGVDKKKIDLLNSLV